MDFFSTGGFQQLLSDLHGYKLDLPIMACDIENLKGYLIEGAENNHPYSMNTDESCYNSKELQRDICEKMYTNTCNELLHVCDPFVNSEADLNHLVALDTQTLYYNKIELNNEATISEIPRNINSVDEFLLSNTHSSYENPNGTQLKNLKNSVFDDRESVAFMAHEMDEWENSFLDNYIEIPELIDFLPEKTPLCTELCEHFLKESSNNLKLYYKHKTPASNSRTDSDKSYPCTFDNCQKMYSKPAHLKAHLRRHFGEKPYICTWPQCTWKFSRSDELARHRRSHSGVKPYKCNYCFKCFARSDHLTKHRKVHERRLLAASKVGKSADGLLPLSVFAVRPGRKRKNQDL